MDETIESSTIINNSNNELNKCIFINTNNPKVKDQVQRNNNSFPLLKPPFPPLIDPKDLLIIGKDNKPTRSPNAFIIYRKVFFKTVRNEGHIFPMTSISSMASQSWEQEPEEIKKYYKRLAKEAYNYRNERFPKKANRRTKKREKWNIISFKSDASISNNNNNNDNDISENINDELLNIENLRLPTPTGDDVNNPLVDAFMQLNEINNVLLQNLLMTNELSLNILNNDNNTQNNIQNNSSINDLEQFNNYFNDNNIELQQEQVYPSPNSSLSDESNFASPNLNDLLDSFPIENLQQMGNEYEPIEPIEQEKEIQQFIIDNDNLSQQISFPHGIKNNEPTNLNYFDNLNAFFDDTQPNFFDCLDNLNNENVIVNDTNTETNSELLTDFIQDEGPDDLGITFPNTEFENVFFL